MDPRQNRRPCESPQTTSVAGTLSPPQHEALVGYDARRHQDSEDEQPAEPKLKTCIPSSSAQLFALFLTKPFNSAVERHNPPRSAGMLIRVPRNLVLSQLDAIPVLQQQLCHRAWIMRPRWSV